MTTTTIEHTYPDATQCIRIGRLLPPAVADLRSWVADHMPSETEKLPLLIISYGAVVVGPWATPAQLQPSLRMAAWTYAFDDYLERKISDLQTLDDFVNRCLDVVRTGQPDNSHFLLTALSAWQQDLSQLPGYPPLAQLWIRTFTRCMRCHRYDWVAGRARIEKGGETRLELTLTKDEYLQHAHSISLDQVQVPRWIAYGGPEVPANLDVLLPALDHLTVAMRLANDLATIDRERGQPGQNNILMYDGVTEEWARDELHKALSGLWDVTAPLATQNYGPALNLRRLAEWAIGTYAVIDLRDLTG